MAARGLGRGGEQTHRYLLEGSSLGPGFREGFLEIFKLTLKDDNIMDRRNRIYKGREGGISGKLLVLWDAEVLSSR